MAHHLAPSLTSGSNVAPQNLRGNYYVTTFTLGVTASASLSISMAALPAGARVADATLTIDNANLFDTATVSARQSVQLFIGGAAQTRDGTGKVVTYITTAQVGTQVNTWAPNEVGVGYRLSASGHVNVVFHELAVGSGTTSTIFTLALQYDTQEDGG